MLKIDLEVLAVVLLRFRSCVMRHFVIVLVVHDVLKEHRVCFKMLGTPHP
jgi:hypothetical protein